MTNDQDIGTIVHEESKTEGFAVMYDGKSDQYYILRGKKKEHLPVRRLKGHFDRKNRYHLDAVLGTY